MARLAKRHFAEEESQIEAEQIKQQAAGITLKT